MRKCIRTSYTKTDKKSDSGISWANYVAASFLDNLLITRGDQPRNETVEFHQNAH
jgi:hypothetical protein